MHVRGGGPGGGVRVRGRPRERGGNVALCAAIGNHGILHRHSTLEPYNTQHPLTCPVGVWDVLFGRVKQDEEQAERPVCVIVWDNVSFQRGILVWEWFYMYQQLRNVCLPPYFLFLSLTGEFFSAWRWKVYD